MRRVVVGFACNNACIFCAQGELRRARFERDVRAAVIAAAKTGEVVAIVGGEPTIAVDVLDLVALAREHGARRVLVQTNGRRLAYEAFARALKDAGATGLDVSLHGSTAPMHDYHTSVPGSFAQTVTGIGVATSVGLEVGVTCVVTRSNYRHLADVVRVAAARGARAVCLVAAVPVGAAARVAARVIATPELLGPHVVDARNVGATLGVRVVTDPAADPIFVGIGEVDATGAAPDDRRRTLPIADST